MERTDFLKNNKTRILTSLISTFIIGIFAHGYIFTHNLILHDNTYNFYLGGTYPLGRWTLEIITRLTNLVNKDYFHFSTPLYLGVLSLVYIALAAIIVTLLFDIKNPFIIVGVSGVMVSFPMVTSLFGFMFMSAVNMLGMLLSVLGAAIIIKVRKWYGFVFGVILLSVSTGVYQAYIATFLSVFLIYFMLETIKYDGKSFMKWFGLRILYYGGAAVAALITYLGIMKFFLWHYNTELLDYQGMRDMGSVGLMGYLSRIPAAYMEFINPTQGVTRNMYPGGVLLFYRISLILGLVLIAWVLVLLWKDSKLKAVMLFLLTVLMPLSVNFIYVMCNDNVHSVMMYGEVFWLVFIACLSECVAAKGRLIPKLSVASASVVLLIMVILYARFSNICYLKGEYIQNSATSYFTRMVSRIESLEGYDDELAVAFAGYSPVPDNNVFMYPEFVNEVNVYPFAIMSVVNNYNWRPFMTVVTGFNPAIVDISEVSDAAAVEAMPSYPDDGSIKIIDDVIVVKY